MHTFDPGEKVEVNGGQDKITLATLLGMAKAGILHLAPNPDMEKIGTLFVDYCQQGNSLGWRQDNLVKALERGLPGSVVKEVFAIKYPAAGKCEYCDDSGYPNNSLKALRVAYKDRSYLLPIPYSGERYYTAAGFEDPGAHHSMAPLALRSFLPAVLDRRDKGEWKVVLRGRLIDIAPQGPANITELS